MLKHLRKGGWPFLTLTLSFFLKTHRGESVMCIRVIRPLRLCSRCDFWQDCRDASTLSYELSAINGRNLLQMLLRSSSAILCLTLHSLNLMCSNLVLHDLRDVEKCAIVCEWYLQHVTISKSASILTLYLSVCLRREVMEKALGTALSLRGCS